MKYTLLLGALLLLFNTCSHKKINWVGSYRFFEEKPFPGNQEVKLQWSYFLEIYKDQGQIKANLKINGYDMVININCHTRREEQSISFIFDEYNSKNHSQDFKSGDILFTLKRQNGQTLTLWETLLPQTQKAGKKCYCFKKIS